jgi:hypothetical protein
MERAFENPEAFTDEIIRTSNSNNVNDEMDKLHGFLVEILGETLNDSTENNFTFEFFGLKKIGLGNELGSERFYIYARNEGNRILISD